jgi:hypothetical protein
MQADTNEIQVTALTSQLVQSLRHQTLAHPSFNVTGLLVLMGRTGEGPGHDEYGKQHAPCLRARGVLRCSKASKNTAYT